jgi:hypothetical protein
LKKAVETASRTICARTGEIPALGRVKAPSMAWVSSSRSPTGCQRFDVSKSDRMEYVIPHRERNPAKSAGSLMGSVHMPAHIPY